MKGSQSGASQRGVLLAELFWIRFSQIVRDRVDIGQRLRRSDACLEMSERLKDRVLVTARGLDIPSIDLLLIDDRHEKFRRNEAHRAAKLRRRDADDCEGMLVELDDPADDVAIVVKTAVPVGITENKIRRAVG